LDGVVPAGTALQATLERVGRPAIAAVGEVEYLLPNGAPGFAEGQALTIEITRESIPGAEPWKRPLAKVSEGEPGLAKHPRGEELAFPSPIDRLESVGWSDLLEEARSGVVQFEGGELRAFVTPAMTLIDVDGFVAALELARAGARAAVRMILRNGIGGSIGIDLPTIDGKAARKSIDDEIDALLPKPFERTAMNGFGFVQIVRPRTHASLLELAQDRAAFEARALMRRASFEPPGPKTLVAHPAVIDVLKAHPGLLDSLARQLGGHHNKRAEPSLPMSGAYASSS
jgi:hypothetical protein